MRLRRPASEPGLLDGDRPGPSRGLGHSDRQPPFRQRCLDAVLVDVSRRAARRLEHQLEQLLVAHYGPPVARIEPVVRVELERVEALELLGMTLAHLNVAEARLEMSPRIPLLMA